MFTVLTRGWQDVVSGLSFGVIYSIRHRMCENDGVCVHVCLYVCMIEGNKRVTSELKGKLKG